MDRILEFRYNKAMGFINLKNEYMELSCAVSPILTDVISVSNYIDGFITYDTNYGNEYIDLHELFELLSEENKNNYMNNIPNIKEVILKEDDNLSKFEQKHDIRGLNLEYTKAIHSQVKITDSENPSNEALFTLGNDNNLKLIVSTFPVGERFFESFQFANEYKSNANF